MKFLKYQLMINNFLKIKIETLILIISTNIKIICFNLYQNKHLKCLFKLYLVLNKNYEMYIINIVYV